MLAFKINILTFILDVDIMQVWLLLWEELDNDLLFGSKGPVYNGQF